VTLCRSLGQSVTLDFNLVGLGLWQRRNSTAWLTFDVGRCNQEWWLSAQALDELPLCGSASKSGTPPVPPASNWNETAIAD